MKLKMPIYSVINITYYLVLGKIKFFDKHKSNNFGTKNLPDAVEWHCSAYWDHALPKKQVNKSISRFFIFFTFS